MAAELAHEAATRAKSARYARDYQFGLSHPVERGVGKDRVELGHEIQGVAVDLADIEPLHARHGQEFVAQIDADDIGAESLDLCRQRTVAAAEIEDPLPGLGAEQTEYRAGELLHEAAILGVVGRRPALHRRGQRGIARRRLRHLGCHGS